VENVRAGKWKALDVTLAFCKRASAAHQLVRIYQNEVRFQS
jgi:hypothetical protein